MKLKLVLRSCIPLSLSVLGLLALANLVQVQTVRGSSTGSAVIIPGQATILTWNTQRVVYTVGAEGITQGGGLRIQFPKDWHRPTEPGLSLIPGQDYYISADTSRSGVELELSVWRGALDGQTDLQHWTCGLTVHDQDLVAGDVVTYTFGDQSGGGRGVRAPGKADEEQVGVAVDWEGDGSFAMLDELPGIEARAASPNDLVLVAPSRVGIGIPFAVAVVARDTKLNAAPSYGGTVAFASTDPLAELPDPYTFAPADGGIETFTVTLYTSGAHWITATDAALVPNGVESNPIDCHSAVPGLRLYWGDVHVHTEFSSDASGRTVASYESARDVARLDFFATTDHSWEGGGYTPAEWEATRQAVSQAYDPGAFVSLLGYEWTVDEPEGHRSIYFRSADEELYSAQYYRTLPGLWAALAGKPALTVPHHTGKQWAGGGTATVEWDLANEQLQRAVEIYSSHGQSEYYNPDDPLSYENVGGAGDASVPGPHYARDGWAAGQRLGVIASADDHAARAGQSYKGMTAVYAAELTREAIFDAIAAGHTYATTGQRILLDFAVDGHMMGEAFTVTLPYLPLIDVRVVGTDLLDWVELMKYDGTTYTAVHSVTQPGTREVHFAYVDPDLEGDAMYYVRVQQVNEVEGRPVRAWSSPVWVDVDLNSDVDLSLAKTASSSAVAPGESLTFTLTFSNTGSDMAAGVLITDVVPGEFTVQAVASSGVAITQSQVAPYYAWQVQDLAPGQGGVITVMGVVTTCLPSGLSFSNSAIISSSGPPDLDPGDNTASVVDIVLNVAPVALKDRYKAFAGQPLIVDPPGVLANDSDANCGLLQAELRSMPRKGTLEFHSDGSFVYVPEAGFTGVDAFTYRASDGLAHSQRVTVAIVVRPN